MLFQCYYLFLGLLGLCLLQRYYLHFCTFHQQRHAGLGEKFKAVIVEIKGSSRNDYHDYLIYG